MAAVTITMPNNEQKVKAAGVKCQMELEIRKINCNHVMCLWKLASFFICLYIQSGSWTQTWRRSCWAVSWVCFLASLFGLSDFHHLSWTPANRFSQHLFSFPVHVVVNFVNLPVLALESHHTSNPRENEAETLMSTGGIWSERAVNNLTSFLVELDLINAKKIEREMFQLVSSDSLKLKSN